MSVTPRLDEIFESKKERDGEAGENALRFVIGVFSILSAARVAVRAGDLNATKEAIELAGVILMTGASALGLTNGDLEAGVRALNSDNEDLVKILRAGRSDAN